MTNKINGISLFSGAGIGEMYLKDVNIDIKIANELIFSRAKLYTFFYPKTKMIIGDITKKEILDQINFEIKNNNCKFLIATPPCQGMSTLGKKDYENDERNYLIFYVIEIIKNNKFDYIIIENVPKFLNFLFPYNNNFYTIFSILIQEFGDIYNIKKFILNSCNYGVSQNRSRAFIKMWKKNLNWFNHSESKEINLKEAIGFLPSLESGESSNIKWHYAKKHNDRDILAMKHTSTGKSALKNDFYYPKKINGEAIKGFHNTYKRMHWNKPSPARTMNSGNIGGHNNVHPGRLLSDGTYSDARVLTLRELFIISSLPPDLDLPNWCTDTFIRNIIGEAIPPKFLKEIIKGIKK
ncbi:Modification methylase [Candidatus Hepatoplasma crinochetorum Av]|uniref:DNA (cytosine-5-)-methyltransferase n=1 Tax=Candidatus Hepatoplasma crinochetorum Av TaxID=1427984 RepID=W8GGB9_9MOLU|nr:DNA cytosine methyltransferase [Candidatus Hepatoplasma crinochetorum]AHK22648.1 Modification methylase [Candidatus Hepatoplasma crinochetorum Av]